MSTADDDLAALLDDLALSPEHLAELLAEQASFDLPQLLAELACSSEGLDALLAELGAHAETDLAELLSVTCPGCGLRFEP